MFVVPGMRSMVKLADIPHLWAGDPRFVTYPYLMNKIISPQIGRGREIAITAISVETTGVFLAAFQRRDNRKTVFNGKQLGRMILS